MRLHCTRWVARDDDGRELGWLEEAADGWRAGVHGVGHITGPTSLVKATQALKAELSARSLREAS